MQGRTDVAQSSLKSVCQGADHKFTRQSSVYAHLFVANDCINNTHRSNNSSLCTSDYILSCISHHYRSDVNKTHYYSSVS